MGGEADIFFKPEDRDDLASFLKQNQNQMPVTIIGSGSNLIIRDGGIEGVTIKLGKNFTSILLLDNNRIEVGAGCLNYNLAKFCELHSVSGFEFLVGIPGTIGGGIVMNAGAYGTEFRDITICVECLDAYGNIVRLDNSQIGFCHRGNNMPPGLLITKVIFAYKLGEKDVISARMREINDMRSKTQPVHEKTSGSTFVNPQASKAWELIDQVGLRGFRIGDAGVSTLHCNFLINYGDAKASDIETLGELMRKKVFEQFGVMLEWEIRRIGRNGRV